MASNVESRTFRATLEGEIMVIEEARDALPDDSHLRALCNLAAERLGDFVSQPRAIAKALQPERAVPAVGMTPPSQIGIIPSNIKGRLAGTIRRIAFDPLHPTGWMFATKLSGMPLEAMLDPSNVMNAAEQLEGQQVLLTGYFAGDVNMRLVADSIEPQ